MNAEQAFEELIETLARRAAGGGMGGRGNRKGCE